jgi:hypothetical protein
MDTIDYVLHEELERLLRLRTNYETDLNDLAVPAEEKAKAAAGLAMISKRIRRLEKMLAIPE